jgi:hypothetical protein
MNLLQLMYLTKQAELEQDMMEKEARKLPGMKYNLQRGLKSGLAERVPFDLTSKGNPQRIPNLMERQFPDAVDKSFYPKTVQRAMEGDPTNYYNSTPKQITSDARYMRNQLKNIGNFQFKKPSYKDSFELGMRESLQNAYAANKKRRQEAPQNKGSWWKFWE